MEKTYIIGRSSETIIKDLNLPIIELPVIAKDEEIHDFIENHIANLDFDSLIIPLFQQDSNLGLEIALHIRLTVALYQKRLIPILFISTDRIGKVLNNAGVYGNLLSTKGCAFEQYDKEVIYKAISLMEGLRVDEYKRGFLNYVIIHPDEKIGRHSLANQWGALSLNRAANTNASLTDRELLKAQKQLYFKYILALTDNYSNISAKGLKVIGHVALGKPDRIDAKNFRVLFIDDEADKGWENVLLRIFKTTTPDNFKIIKEKVKTFDDFPLENQKLIINGDFDLYLIDLRLNGFDEEEIINPNEFSGTKILKKLKSINEGNQVIIFTASNKAWNMKSLLDIGADGYYIKESPEYNFPFQFSKENYSNFKIEVNNCFELYFLKNIVQKHNEMIVIMKTKMTGKPLLYQLFYDRSESALTIALDLLKKTVKNKKYFSLAYLTYYQILEDYVSQKENFEFVSKSECYVDNRAHRVIDDSSGDLIWQLTYIQDAHNGDYFKKASIIYTEEKLVQSLAKISMVLAFQHAKDDIYLKKWGKSNQIRNSKASHGNSGVHISLAELLDLLEVVYLFLMN